LEGDNRSDKNGNDNNNPNGVDAQFINLPDELFEKHTPPCGYIDCFPHQQNILPKLMQRFIHWMILKSIFEAKVRNNPVLRIKCLKRKKNINRKRRK
jgi:hypothetical protein